MAISRPQRRRHCAIGIASTSSPLKRTAPPATTAGGHCSSRMTAEAVTLLPEPLSPRIAAVSPGRMLKFAPLTA